MPLAAQQPRSAAYSVEVSGWDDSHTFFVESTELCWNEESGKELTLSRRLRHSAMIFVRLLQATDAEQAFPVAYETEALCSYSEKPQRFRLKRVAPRSACMERTWL